MDGWMALPSKGGQPERTSFFIPPDEKPHQLHSPDKRLPSYTFKRLRRGLARRGGREAWTWARCGSFAAGMNTGPVRAECAYTTLSDWIVFARLFDPAAPLLQAQPMRCYTIRGPLYGPTVSDSQGRAAL